MMSVNEMLVTSLGMLAGVAVALFVGIRLAHRWDVLLDRPGLQVDPRRKVARRKRHARPTPVVGGLVLLLALAMVWVVLPFPFEMWWTLPFGMGILGLLGVLDDLYDTPALMRFLVQFAVTVVVVVFGGIEVQSLGNLLGFGEIRLGPLSAPVTVLAIMLIINAVNMIDGIDGLAGSVALVATVAYGLLAFAEGVGELATFSWLLVAGLVAFLLFNLRTPWRAQASVFLGDSGSMMLGFWLAWMAVAITQMPGSSVPAATVALILIFPAGDLFGVFVRRLRLRRSPMTPDRGHTHHVLIRAGFSAGQVVAILVPVYGLWIAFALTSYLLQWPEWLQFGVAAIVFLGYIGFILNGHRIIRWWRRKAKKGTE